MIASPAALAGLTGLTDRRTPLAHAARAGTTDTLCGARVTGTPAGAGAEKCVVCVEMIESQRWSLR